jgi:hypothetical protein
MKKTFPLHAPGRADERVVEAIKHDVRKYVKRERGKSLPTGFDQWDFNCRVGLSASAATVRDLRDVARAIDEVVQLGSEEVYVEIFAVAALRTPRLVSIPAATALPVEVATAAFAPPAEQSQSS